MRAESHKGHVGVEQKVLELLKDLMGTVGGDPMQLKSILTGATTSMWIPEQKVSKVLDQDCVGVEVVSSTLPFVPSDELGNDPDQLLQMEEDDGLLGDDNLEKEGQVEVVSGGGRGNLVG